MLKTKLQKSLFRENSILTPWQTDIDDTCINKYCSDYVPKINVYTDSSKENNLPKIHPKKRAISHCNTHIKVDSISNIHNRVDSISNAQRYNENKIHCKSQVENYHQTFQTLFQHKTERPQRKRPQSRGPLQELNVKNFIIEGGQPTSNLKQKHTKKRQSSYIMKQKFAEFRRSMKRIEQNKENSNLRGICY